MGDTLSVNIALQVGTQAETVTVTAEAPLLEASSAATGQVVDSKRLESLPLPASNPIVTTMLAVNMTMLTSPTSTYTPDANNQVTNTAAVGTRQGQSVQAIDGMPSMQGGGTTGIVPPPEILQEVKISTAPYDASLGHFTGAQINMVTKSGTNGLHGALVFWNTNTSLNALSYFSKLSINNPATGTGHPRQNPRHRSLHRLQPLSRNHRRAAGDPQSLQRPEPHLLAIRGRLFLHAVFHQRAVHRAHREAAHRRFFRAAGVGQPVSDLRSVFGGGDSWRPRLAHAARRTTSFRRTA